MCQRLRNLDGHRHDVEFRIDALRVGTLVARNLRLRHQRVHDPALVAFPWVGCAPQQRASGTLKQAGPLERRQGPHDGRRVARHDARRIAIERAGIVRLRRRRMAGGLVLLAALDDELEAAAAIAVDVLRGDALGRAVHHDVSLAEQVVQCPRDAPVRQRAFALMCSPVAPNRRKPFRITMCARQSVTTSDTPASRHVLLKRHRGGHALADHAIAIDSDTDLLQVQTLASSHFSGHPLRNSPACHSSSP